jgi:hypothetical protein
MSEAERLQKIVQAQEKEIAKLRRMLGIVRIAHLEYGVDEGTLHITGTAIGVDEFHFLDQVRDELKMLADAITGGKAEITALTDMVSGEPMTGGVSPQP